MKSNIVLPILLAFSPLLAQAQSTEMQHLDINQLKVTHLSQGDMWYDITTFAPGFEFPKGSGKHASYAFGLWASARDADDTLYTATTLYRSSGQDYYSGPLNDTGYCTPAISKQWDRIWKVSHSDITAFKALTSRTTATVPANILEWPAKGNPYARGAAGASLTLTTDMAPFVDADGDGSYNALLGDYPRIKGDQMLWWVINDNTLPHTISKGHAMRVEYRIMAYAYSRGTAADRIVFYEFEARNKSKTDYQNFRLGFWSDVDLGSAFDDYLAFDSFRRAGICYNAALPDAPGKYSYGSHPPMTGYTLLETPGDVYPGGMQPAGTFNRFEGAAGKFRDPSSPSDFAHYMQGLDADGNLFPGSPYWYDTKGGMVMCKEAAPLSDKRFLLNSNAYHFAPGSVCKLGLAAVVTDTVGYSCATMTDFKPVIDMVDTAWKIYYNPMPPLSVRELAALDRKLRIYPNPASNSLFLDSYTGKTIDAAGLKVYDLNGRAVMAPVSQQGKQAVVDISNLASGVYSIRYDDGTTQVTQLFVKR